MEKYDRLKGVSPPCYLLMKILCFGEMGGPYYRDEVIGSADTPEEIIRCCEKNGHRLDGPWAEYFIKEVEF